MIRLRSAGRGAELGSFAAAVIVAVGLLLVFSIAPSSRATPPGVAATPRCLQNVPNLVAVERQLLLFEQALGVTDNPLWHDTRGLTLARYAASLAQPLYLLTGNSTYRAWARLVRRDAAACRAANPHP